MLSLIRLSAPCITYLNTWTRLHILIQCRLVSAAPSALSKIEYYVTRVVSQSESSMEETHQLRQPIRIEYCVTRRPIRIEYYVIRVVSQSESSITSPASCITSPESSRLRWRSLLGSRLESARFSLS